MSIRIVTDSSSDIPWDFADKHGIKVVPLSVTYYDKNFKETRDFDLDKHYSYYETDPNFLPKTSQPSPKEYYTVYNELIKEGAKDILVVCISSALSGTLNSARLAANMIQEKNSLVKIHLIDSLNASYPEVFLVEDALDLIAKNEKVEEIVDHLNLLVKKIRTHILIPTLKYLHLGGRISIAKYLLSRLLRKQVITRVNAKGTNETAKIIKNTDQGLEELINLTIHSSTTLPRKLAIVHANNAELAEKLKGMVKEKIPKADLKIVRTKCTISAHTGPNAVALIADFGADAIMK